jgi:glucosamine kinase
VSAGWVVGVDGGGTHTTVVLADARGREILRSDGPPGIVDPRSPRRAAEVVAALVRESAAAAGMDLPAAALCAGLAGVEYPAERRAVADALREAGLARAVEVVTDGRIALEGALGAGAGILLIAGTGSVAYGRAEDGRTARCGGWGMVLGDEGSGYGIGRDALRAALQAADGRGPSTRLLEALLEGLRLPSAAGVPPWVGRAEKRDVAGLVPVVVRVAGEGDHVAAAVLRNAAHALADHAAALAARLAPWATPIPIVLHGGVFRQREIEREVRHVLQTLDPPFEVRMPRADAPAGAVLLAVTHLADSIPHR